MVPNEMIKLSQIETWLVREGQVGSIWVKFVKIMRHFFAQACAHRSKEFFDLRKDLAVQIEAVLAPIWLIPSWLVLPKMSLDESFHCSVGHLCKYVRLIIEDAVRRFCHGANQLPLLLTIHFPSTAQTGTTLAMGLQPVLNQLDKLGIIHFARPPSLSERSWANLCACTCPSDTSNGETEFFYSGLVNVNFAQQTVQLRTNVGNSLRWIWSLEIRDFC